MELEAFIDHYYNLQIVREILKCSFLFWYIDLTYET